MGKLVFVVAAKLAVKPSPDEIQTAAEGHFRVTTSMPAFVVRNRIRERRANSAEYSEFMLKSGVIDAAGRSADGEVLAIQEHFRLSGAVLLSESRNCWSSSIA